MDGGITILRPDDAGRAATLHAACFDTRGRWSARSMRESLTAPTTLALGHEAGGHLDALLLIQRLAPDAEILTICVDPSARRKGLAQRLFDHGRRLLGPYGIERFLLDVAADNFPAIAFYEQNGFTRDGMRKAYYSRDDGRAVDAVLMSRTVAGQTDKSGA